MTEDIQFSVSGGLARVLLNRPKALNALTLDMIRLLDPRLRAWAEDPAVKAVLIEGAGDRAFCAGGDVLAVWQAGKAQAALAKEFFREEYTLNRRIHTYPKPFIALLDGITMGGGVGLSVHGSIRIATEAVLFAMPETGIGLFPDVGGSWFLPRCPGETGTYLGLTGARLGAADCCGLGIATHHVKAARLGEMEAALAAADWAGDDADRVAGSVIESFAADPGLADLMTHRTTIDSCFRFDTIEEILAALERDGSDFAGKTLATLAQKSPTSLKVSLRQLRLGRRLSFDECMTMEYRLSQACIDGHDFFEGVRALLIDKDKNPVWQPSTLAAVTPELVSRHFESLGNEDLVFTP